MPIELMTNETLGYMYSPLLPSHILKFKVKAANDAHIILSEIINPADSDPVVEIFIGGWKNQKSAIRRNRVQSVVATADTPNILSKDEFRSFWLTYLGGDIAVGKEDEVQPFLTWTSPVPLSFNYFGVCTKYGASGHWVMHLDVTWVPCKGGAIPFGAVAGGYDKEILYVGRVRYEGAVVPGKVHCSKGLCYIAWGGAEASSPEYEVLTGPNLQWVTSQDGVVPDIAVEGGRTENGETLYIGRAQYTLVTNIIGKVQPSHKVCYISYDGREISFPKYEVLVQK